MASLQREHSMEVDPPPGPSNNQPPASSGGSLKRSNSAPMINVLVSQPEISPPTSTFKVSECSRLRRFSSSSMSLNQCGPSTPVKIPDRVNRLKDEEIHIVEKEKEHERDVSSAIKMSSSWQDFSLEDSHEAMQPDPHRRPRSFSESLHINVFPQPTMLVGTPSPTRVGNRKVGREIMYSYCKI
ncbi:P2R1A-PPP2R2A-interacting phosphatase regulator 1-like [Saccostrea cucullata]|uniref:P2R1A-PPP2R2A-interacting phosphatase regulator 1-like n=1 Tax=Saccostrea cuccullata TaxID=36930 RepID=UPI002ED4BAC2